MNEQITVIKLSPRGEEMWRYEGRVIERDEASLVLEAFFDREDRPFMGTTLKRGDRFVEFYYTERWYNVFEIYDRDSGEFKGYYGNVSTPARFLDGRIEYRDLFLDVWADPHGRQTVLDEDEFAAGDMEAVMRERALAGLSELKAELNRKRPRR
jgi:protein associated with RNAse G/E